jgi:tetratricopeptide (TPR) repeat protein
VSALALLIATLFGSPASAQHTSGLMPFGAQDAGLIVAPHPNPTPTQLDAFRQLDAEVRDFLNRGTTFQADVNDLVARQHTRTVERRRHELARQITSERRAEVHSRDHAIARIERFLAEYPDDPERTPDVMLRLAELYFDKAADAHLDAAEGDEVPADHRCSILLYRHIAARFPTYRHADATHYRLGWALRAMEHEDEALSAWRTLVCPSHDHYTGALDLAAPDRGGRPLACPALFDRLRQRDPSLVTPTSPPETSTPARDDEGCEPMRGADGRPSRYTGEVWYHVGDLLFERAINDTDRQGVLAAYRASMRASSPDDRDSYWPRALYKLAWTHFRRQDGAEEALRTFVRLLDHYDRVGAPEASHRDDALRWIAVILVESGDDGANTPASRRCQDLVESSAHPPANQRRPFDCVGLARVQSSDIPQDRRWTPDVYLGLANEYFNEAKFYEAITLFRAFLGRFPSHAQAPRVAESIAIARERLQMWAAACNASCHLPDYSEGTAWWNANVLGVGPQTASEWHVQHVLRGAATNHHREAARLRQEAIGHMREARSRAGSAQAREEMRAVETFGRADAEYAAALNLYTTFITRFPNAEDAYECRYDRADALFWSGRYAEAAAAYESVRESNENDTFLVSAAFMVVRAWERHLVSLVRAGQMEPCTAIRAGISRELLVNVDGTPLIGDEQAAACTQPPTRTEGGRVVPIELAIPEVVQSLMRARVVYSTHRALANRDNSVALREVVQDDPDHPENNAPYRSKFTYLNARTYMRFGHLREAEELDRRILELYCGDALVTAATLTDLRTLLTLEGRLEDLESLARDQHCRCVAHPENLPLVEAPFRRAIDAYRIAGRAPPDQAEPLYEQAAAQFQAALRRNASHPQAALALFYTALAYERAGFYATAARTYERIVRDYDSTRDARGEELVGEDRLQRINILEQSHFRAAVNRERMFDFDEAIEHYQSVATDPRFGSATDHAAHVHDALASIALIRTHQAP